MASVLNAAGRFRPADPLSDGRRNRIGAGLIEFALDGAIMVRSSDLGASP
jgi:hypothetical protein